MGALIVGVAAALVALLFDVWLGWDVYPGDRIEKALEHFAAHPGLSLLWGTLIISGILGASLFCRDFVRRVKKLRR